MGEVKQIESVEDCASFLEHNSLAVIDFYADWCGPCKMIAPKVKELALANASVKFGKVNVDDAEEVAQKYEVSAMPTFILFKDGKKFDTIVGANEAKLREGVEKLLK
ncbi:thioredoxin-1-like [Lytechinus variegatus]|uniref:thioredoxin-1-like n=1 Tax=Lytechinus variegatus TaxID=7654 RepID=UPI001BB2792C|nr:thioredoxin-1-like [Lytechinus variegatus]